MKKRHIFQKIYLGLIMLFFYFPIAYVILFSFNESKSLTSFTGFSLKWYDKLFSSRTMMESVYYSLLVAVIATIVSTIVGTIVAIGLSKSNKVINPEGSLGRVEKIFNLSKIEIKEHKIIWSM